MIISWPTTPGYILQQNSQLNISAGWLNTVYVVTTNSFTKTNSIIIYSPIRNLFFRLANP
jgi:hypothetical protein